MSTRNGPPRAGDRLGRHILTKEIGRGGYAVVFAAEDTESGEHIAIKTLRSTGPRLDDAKERFRIEADVLSQLVGADHVVRLIERQTEDEPAYIVMELLEGCTLSDLLDISHTIVLDRAISFTIDILRALVPVHRCGVVHRDLKPENIFILSDDSATLLDFGLVMVEDAKRPAGYTIFDNEWPFAMGTPNYMSPEAAQGKEVDARSDIYSVGILLYEMLVGRAPYAGGTCMGIMLRHVNSPLPRLPGRYSGSPVEKIIRRALFKEPERRYRSANDMASALRSHLRTIRTHRSEGSPC